MTGARFPTRASAAQWTGGQIYAHAVATGDTLMAKCSMGVHWKPLEPGEQCGNIGVGFCNSKHTSADENSAWNGSVATWGFGYQYSWSTEKKKLICLLNYPVVIVRPQCPSGWIAHFDYPPQYNNPVYYCTPAQSTPNGATPYSKTPDGPSNADKSNDCNTCGVNPVNLSTGAKHDAVIDYQNRSPYPIKLIRYYTNRAIGWHFNYDIRIISIDHHSNNAHVIALREDGTQLYFKSTNADPSTPSTQWTWTPVQHANSKAIGSTLKVYKTSSGGVSGYEIKNMKGETETYNGEGLLLNIENERGNFLTFSYDTKKRLSLIEDDYGRSLNLEYNNPTLSSNTWENEDPNASPVNTEFEEWDTESKQAANAHRMPTRVYDESIEIKYSYDATKNNFSPNTSTPSIGNLVPRLISVENADGSIIQYKYAEQGHSAYNVYLTGIVGEDGQRLASYYYDGANVKETIRGNGLKKITYNYHGRTIKDAYNNIFNLRLDAQYTADKPTGFPNGPCPPEVCSGEGAQLKNITFDVYGNPLTKTDYNNRVTTLTWNGPRALPLTITQATGTPLARTTIFTWHGSKRLPLTKVEPIKVGSVNGTRTTTWAYDATGRLLSETQSNSINSQTRTRSFTYNALGLVKTATDARGKTTEFIYDVQGNLIAQENALGQITTWTDYTPRGLPGKTVSPTGLETIMTYDARDRITQIKRGSTSSGFETWNVAWLPIGKIDRITRPDGIIYKLLYDSAHDLIEMQERSASDALLGKRVFTLDLMGRLTKEEAFDAGGVKIAARGQAWNTLSRLYQTKGADNQTTTLSYDADGNLTGVSDPLTHTNGATVDALGRTVSMIDALNKTSTLAYDVQDNLVSAVDARGVSTGYGYNAFNDLLATYSPDRGSWTMAVDANGNTIQTIDPRGVEATVIYDDLNRPTSVSWSDDNVLSSPSGFTPGDQTALYTWDTCTNGTGRLCVKSDWTGTYAYSYDLWGRLTGESFIPAGNTFALATGYAFDNAGRQSAQVYPSGKALTLGYGVDGRISGTTWSGSALTSNMTHQPMGGPALGWTWSASGIPATRSQVAYTYDLDGRMSNISDIQEVSHIYDAASRLGAVEHQPSSDPDMVYAYDAKSRLTSADNATWSAATSYTYDFGDNRTSRTQGGNGWSYAYGLVDNRMASVSPLISGVAGSPLSQSYDAMGNLIQSAGKTYSYDAAGRMVAASFGASSANYQVNANGLRVRKTVSGAGATDEIVIYDGQRRRIGVYKPMGGSGFSVEEELVYLPGSWQIVATVRGQAAGGTDGIAYPVLSDHLGTPRAVLDPSTGDRRWSWSSKEAFADTPPNQNPDGSAAGAFVFNARFPGQFLDTETELFHNGYRDYDAKLGRYVQSDPIGLNGGWNTYSYTSAHPTGMFDADGLLQRNPDGTLKFTGVRYGSSSHAENYTTRLTMEGHLYADDGTPIEAMLNLDPGAPKFNTDCHGYAFADGKYWINNDQVSKIIKGDGYRWIGAGIYNGSGYTMHPKSRPMNKEDIIIYSRNGQVVHSAIYEGGNKISHKPGIVSDRPENATIDTGWNWRSANENENYQIGIFRK